MVQFLVQTFMNFWAQKQTLWFSFWSQKPTLWFSFWSQKLWLWARETISWWMDEAWQNMMKYLIHIEVEALRTGTSRQYICLVCLFIFYRWNMKITKIWKQICFGDIASLVLKTGRHRCFPKSLKPNSLSTTHHHLTTQTIKELPLNLTLRGGCVQNETAPKDSLMLGDFASSICFSNKCCG